MLARCYNPNHHGYKDYGGRGIQVHESWRPAPPELTSAEAFRNFIRDVGLRPNSNMSLDRINADGNYEFSNCCWATAKEQGRNKRLTVRVVDPDNPENMIPVAELAERMHIRYQTLRYRLRKQGLWPNEF